MQEMNRRKLKLNQTILSDEVACWSETVWSSAPGNIFVSPKCWCGRHEYPLVHLLRRFFAHPDELPPWRDQYAELLLAVDEGKIR